MENMALFFYYVDNNSRIYTKLSNIVRYIIL